MTRPVYALVNAPNINMDSDQQIIGARMTLKLINSIVLPEHDKPGGFDHAAFYRKLNLLYVALTANDAVDVIDVKEDR